MWPHGTGTIPVLQCYSCIAVPACRVMLCTTARPAKWTSGKQDSSRTLLHTACLLAHRASPGVGCSFSAGQS